MKRLVSLILTVCFVFLAANTIWPADICTEENSDGFISNLLCACDFTLILENENIDVENADAYDICFLIELEESLPDSSLVFDASNIFVDDNGVDVALKTHRDNVKDYYVTYNETNVANLGLENYEYYISYYSPYIEIVFDDIEEYESCEGELITSITSADVVLTASNYAVYEKSNIEATVDSSSYSTNYPLSQAFEDIGVLDSSFTGDGVIVGVIDVGIPDSTVNMKAGHYTMVGTYEDDHSTVITSIIGGTSGIAEDVHFICSIGGSKLINSCNLLIGTYNVNIINMSLGYASVGYYTNYDACIDNIVSNTGCTFVKSAGNEGLGSAVVTAPGCAMNAITVGSMNYSHNVRANSSWSTSNDFLLKPDVVAPGGRLWDIPNLANGNGGHSGTSYAAPMVVGTIALLMEEFPLLKTNPALVKSVLHLGAEKLPSQTAYFDEQAGFGLINYPNMRNCLLNSNYSNFTISTTASEGDTVLSFPVTISYFDQIIINANSIINSSNEENGATQAVPVYTDYTIKIYDLGTSTYVATSTIDSSVDYLLFTNDNSSNSAFRIDIVLESDNVSGEAEFGSIAYELLPHSHSYTSRYAWQSDLRHKCYCECGEYSTGAHVVPEGAFSDTVEYAICLLCRGRVSMGVLNSVSINELPHTLNGSYILSNGTIVLVDEDIDAYMNGTLVFRSGEIE